MSNAPISRTAQVDSSGNRLRGDAAASYLRMLNDGMPSGGIDVFLRTMKQQEALYIAFKAGRGPRAAPPSLTAPHIDGRAMDAHTTTNGKYAPSGAHSWMVSGGDGSRPPKAGEKLRAHQYGWFRTVSTERWHWEYDRSRDTKRTSALSARLKALGYSDLRAFQRASGLSVDGVDGPMTWSALLGAKPAPKPVPAPPVTPAQAETITILVANLHDPRFGGPRDQAAQATYVAGLKPDVILTSESRSEDRDAIVTAMRSRGRSWKSWPSATGSVGLMWDAEKFDNGPKVTSDFGDGYHAAVASTLTIRSIRRAIRFISTHTRPAAVASDVQKRKDIEKAAGLKSGLSILGGDLAKNKPEAWLPGWARLTPSSLDTMDTAGHESLDSLWSYGPGVSVARVQLVNPGSYSDHRWLLVTLTVTAPTGVTT